jgi:hypothetical protein
MKTWTKFWESVFKCAKKLAKKELGLKIDTTDISREQAIQLVRFQARCYYEKLSKVGDRRFNKMIDELMEPMIESVKQVDSALLDYLSKFGNVQNLLELGKFGNDINNAILDEMVETVDPEDARMLGRMWSLSYLRGQSFDIMMASIQPLRDILAVANIAVELDYNWAVSLIALVLEEAMVKAKLRELGIKPGDRELFHKLTDKLVKKLEELGKRPTQEVLLTDGYRNVRQKVVHDPVKWKPTENDMHDVVRHACQLAEALWPDKFKLEQVSTE